ncbi:recombinase family protein [Mucilaginibacter sp. Bleaf8]|uniref:recombinase family protein n=1 Tax=Mucilaginibacter sp. Bleaf8 TaxID=2834430 RepID=UPI001BD0E648|nr:recombinase family protein [Mucilaginibacter sp. Bleaf8]MBS7566752.1 recombinase family protein [Mucilaginibacter sp. Bleaf8]
MTKQQLIAYYRVSTAGQGKSGLGLEAQRSSVNRFLRVDQQVLKEFIEIESGKNNNRQVLKEALAYAHKHKATLVIAKLDRLARNAAFIFALRDSGVNFVCADMPEANTLTIGIFATLAQYERELISERTKKALAAKKEQGFTLGKPENLTLAAGRKGADTMRRKALTNDHNRRASAMINNLRAAGHTWTSIASQLNAFGFHTSQGKQFRVVQVQRIFKNFSPSTGP